MPSTGSPPAETYLLAKSALARALEPAAIAACDTALHLNADDDEVLTSCGTGYAAAGRRSQALRLLDMLQMRDSTRGYVDPFRMASLAAATYSGPADGARMFAWLGRALDDRSSNLCFIRLNRVFRRFDADPRASSLVQRLAFPT